MCHNETPIFRDIHSRYGGSILEFIYASPTNVLKYYLYKSTKAVEFYRPIMYLFFLAQGLTFTQIAILEAIYNLTTLVGEIPTGYIGDRVGRRNSPPRRRPSSRSHSLASASPVRSKRSRCCTSAGQQGTISALEAKTRGCTTPSQTAAPRTHSRERPWAGRVHRTGNRRRGGYHRRVSRKHRPLVSVVRRFRDDGGRRARPPDGR